MLKILKEEDNSSKFRLTNLKVKSLIGTIELKKDFRQLLTEKELAKTVEEWVTKRRNAQKALEK